MSDHSLRLDHIGLRVTNLQRSTLFYTAALEPLGMCLLGESSKHAAFGIGSMPYLSIRLAERVAGPTHVAFLAESHAQVDAFYLAGISAGGTDGGCRDSGLTTMNIIMVPLCLIRMVTI